MKLERVGLNLNKNEVKKEREAKNNFTMTKFSLPKMQKGNLLKDFVSFGAPITYIDTKRPGYLSQAAKEFIEHFDDLTFSRKSAYKLGSGQTSNAYYIKDFGFVIKQNFEKFARKIGKRAPGSLFHENLILKKLNPKVEEYSQKQIAFIQTENDNEYLISSFAYGNEINYNARKLNFKDLDRILRVCYRLDKNGILQTDMACGNIFLDSNSKPTFLDYQWAIPDFTYNSLASYLNCQPFPDFEIPANDTQFETCALGAYLNEMSKNESSLNCREFLKNYLMKKSKYCQKKAQILEKNTRGYNYEKERIEFEKAKANVFRNPSESVINCELLRINILHQFRKQYSVTELPICGEPKNLIKFFVHAASLKLSAETLKDLDTPDYLSQDEKTYFRYMKRYGQYWSNMINNIFKQTSKSILDHIQGYEYNNEYFDKDKIVKVDSAGDLKRILDIPYNVSSRCNHDEKFSEISDLYDKRYKLCDYGYDFSKKYSLFENLDHYLSGRRKDSFTTQMIENIYNASHIDIGMELAEEAHLINLMHKHSSSMPSPREEKVEKDLRKIMDSQIETLFSDR